MNVPRLPAMPLPAEPKRPTTVTLLTPAGRGAIATLSVEGPGAIGIVGEFFRPAGQPLSSARVDRIRFGTWCHEHGDPEEVVVCRRDQTVLEIHCHGGDAAAAAIIAALTSRGAVVGDGAAWLHRQLCDPLGELVQLKLAEARTQRAAGILLDQLHGAWTESLCQIESAFHSNNRQTADIQRATERLQRLIDLIPLGRHLTEPWRVVVVGLPNVGKSSLVNTMLGFSRCIVFDQPGTTRDVVATHTAFDGWPVELSDTAGVRSGQNAIEAEGVERALSSVSNADLVVHVGDATRPGSSLTEPAVTEHANVISVENKTDLLEDPTVLSQQSPTPDVRTSAVTKSGVPQLIDLIVARLVPTPPAPGEAVPIGETQIKLLEAMRARFAENPC